MELYNKAITICSSILEIQPNDCMALKGLGLSQYCLDYKDIGKENLYRSIEYADGTFMEPFTDLISVLINEGFINEASEVLAKALHMNPNYVCPHSIE